MDLNKFQAVSTEHLLVIKALDLVNNDSHWASVVFENLQPNSSVPPVHIKYKIRMDTNDVEHSDDIEHRCVNERQHNSTENIISFLFIDVTLDTT